MSTFDVIAHHRERRRVAELRADGLERQRDRLQRLLTLAVRAAAGKDCEPLVLLRALEEMLDTADTIPNGPSIDELVQLLRETDPAQVPRAA